MKNIVRYECGAGDGMYDDINGEWVLASDVTTLIKENKNLKEEIELLKQEQSYSIKR